MNLIIVCVWLATGATLLGWNHPTAAGVCLAVAILESIFHDWSR